MPTPVVDSKEVVEIITISEIEEGVTDAKSGDKAGTKNGDANEGKADAVSNAADDAASEGPSSKKVDVASVGSKNEDGTANDEEKSNSAAEKNATGEENEIEVNVAPKNTSEGGKEISESKECQEVSDGADKAVKSAQVEDEVRVAVKENAEEPNTEKTKEIKSKEDANSAKCSNDDTTAASATSVNAKSDDEAKTKNDTSISESDPVPEVASEKDAAVDVDTSSLEGKGAEKDNEASGKPEVGAKATESKAIDESSSDPVSNNETSTTPRDVEKNATAEESVSPEAAAESSCNAAQTKDEDNKASPIDDAHGKVAQSVDASAPGSGPVQISDESSKRSANAAVDADNVALPEKNVGDSSQANKESNESEKDQSSSNAGSSGTGAKVGDGAMNTKDVSTENLKDDDGVTKDKVDPIDQGGANASEKSETPEARDSSAGNAVSNPSETGASEKKIDTNVQRSTSSDGGSNDACKPKATKEEGDAGSTITKDKSPDNDDQGQTDNVKTPSKVAPTDAITDVGADKSAETADQSVDTPKNMNIDSDSSAKVEHSARPLPILPDGVDERTFPADDTIGPGWKLKVKRRKESGENVFDRLFIAPYGITYNGMQQVEQSLARNNSATSKTQHPTNSPSPKKVTPKKNSASTSPRITLDFELPRLPPEKEEHIFAADAQIGPGWTIRVKKRITYELSKPSPQVDRYFIAPDGQQFRSKVEVERFLNGEPIRLKRPKKNGSDSPSTKRQGEGESLMSPQGTSMENVNDFFDYLHNYRNRSQARFTNNVDPGFAAFGVTPPQTRFTNNVNPGFAAFGVTPVRTGAAVGSKIKLDFKLPELPEGIMEMTVPAEREIGPGWKFHIKKRIKSPGAVPTAPDVDRIIISPDNKKFRGRPQVERYLNQLNEQSILQQGQSGQTPTQWPGNTQFNHNDRRFGGSTINPPFEQRKKIKLDFHPPGLPDGTNEHVYPADQQIGPGWKIHVKKKTPNPSSEVSRGPNLVRFYVAPNGQTFRAKYLVERYLNGEDERSTSHSGSADKLPKVKYDDFMASNYGRFHAGSHGNFQGTANSFSSPPARTPFWNTAARANSVPVAPRPSLGKRIKLNFRYPELPEGEPERTFAADDKIGPGWKIRVVERNRGVNSKPGPRVDHYLIAPDGSTFRGKVAAERYLNGDLDNEATTPSEDKKAIGALKTMPEEKEIYNELIESITDEYRLEVEKLESTSDNIEKHLPKDFLKHLIEEMTTDSGVENFVITESMIIDRFRETTNARKRQKIDGGEQTNLHGQVSDTTKEQNYDTIMAMYIADKERSKPVGLDLIIEQIKKETGFEAKREEIISFFANADLDDERLLRIKSMAKRYTNKSEVSRKTTGAGSKVGGAASSPSNAAERPKCPSLTIDMPLREMVLKCFQDGDLVSPQKGLEFAQLLLKAFNLEEEVFRYIVLHKPVSGYGVDPKNKIKKLKTWRKKHPNENLLAVGWWSTFLQRNVDFFRSKCREVDAQFNPPLVHYDHGFPAPSTGNSVPNLSHGQHPANRRPRKKKSNEVIDLTDD